MLPHDAVATCGGPGLPTTRIRARRPRARHSVARGRARCAEDLQRLEESKRPLIAARLRLVEDARAVSERLHPRCVQSNVELVADPGDDALDGAELCAAQAFVDKRRRTKAATLPRRSSCNAGASRTRHCTPQHPVNSGSTIKATFSTVCACGREVHRRHVLAHYLPTGLRA